MLMSGTSGGFEDRRNATAIYLCGYKSVALLELQNAPQMDLATQMGYVRNAESFLLKRSCCEHHWSLMEAYSNCIAAVTELGESVADKRILLRKEGTLFM